MKSQQTGIGGIDRQIKDDLKKVAKSMSPSPPGLNNTIKWRNKKMNKIEFRVGDKVKITSEGIDNSFDPGPAGMKGIIVAIEENSHITKGQLCTVDVPGYGQSINWAEVLMTKRKKYLLRLLMKSWLKLDLMD